MTYDLLSVGYEIFSGPLRCVWNAFFLKAMDVFDSPGKTEHCWSLNLELRSFLNMPTPPFSVTAGHLGRATLRMFFLKCLLEYNIYIYINSIYMYL